MSSRTRSPSALGLVVALCALVASIAGASEPSVVRFGLFTDLHAHDLDSPLEEKWMTHADERVAAFTESMNALGVDFVVQLGDFVNGWFVLGADPGDPERMPAVLAWADSLYAAFAGPRVHVIGNHDVFNLTKAEIRDVLGLERTYSSFDVGEFHFVVLDVQFAADGSDLANTYSGVAGYVPDAELVWLRDDLAAHAARPTVVFVHQMLDSYVEEWGRPLVANQADVQQVLTDAGNVIAVLQGHDHAYAHEVVLGVHYVTFEALVDRGEPPSWAIVTLDAPNRTVTIDGTGEQPSLAFSYAPVPTP